MLEFGVNLHVAGGSVGHGAKLREDDIRDGSRGQCRDEHARLLQNALLDQLGWVLRQPQEDFNEHADADVVRYVLAYVREGLGARSPHAVHVVFGQPHKGGHEALEQLVLAAHLAYKVKVECSGFSYSEYRVLGQGDHFGDNKLLAQVLPENLRQGIEQLGSSHSPFLLLVLVRETQNNRQHMLPQIVSLDKLRRPYQGRDCCLPNLGFIVF